MILETSVGRARWCVQTGVWREATTPQAHACREERQSQAPGWTCQWVRSALTQAAIANKGRKLNGRRVFPAVASGQLRFLG
jgi:hypothetical protein